MKKTVYKYKTAIYGMLAMALSTTACSTDEPNQKTPEVDENGMAYLTGEIEINPVLNPIGGVSRSVKDSIEISVQDFDLGDGLSMTIEQEPMPDIRADESYNIPKSRASLIGSPYGFDIYASEGVPFTAIHRYGNDTRTVMFKDLRFYRNNDGRWRSPEGKRYSWPHRGEVELIGWSPTANATPGETSTTIRVTASNWADEQYDICTHHSYLTMNDKHSVGNKTESSIVINTQFKHIMAGLRIRFAPKPGRKKINRFDVTGIPKVSGTYDIVSGVWSDLSGPGAMYTSYQGETNNRYRKNFNNITLSDHIFNDVMTQEQTFMVIPQTITSNDYMKVVVFREDGSSIEKNFRVPTGLEFKAGYITTLNISESTLTLEEETDIYQLNTTDGNERKWDVGNLRLVANNIYEGEAFFSRAIREWSDPNEGEGHDNWDYNTNQWGRWGHRTNFNIYYYMRGDGEKTYLTSYDNRFNYFIGSSAEENLSFRECRGMHCSREQILDPRGNRRKDTWYSNKVTAEWVGTSCPWQTLGGQIKIRVDYNTKRIRFTPVKRDGRDDFVYPWRLPINGSIHGLCYVELDPYDSHEGNYTSQSFNEHYLVHQGNGVYTAEVNINQFFEPRGTGVNTKYYLLNGWRGYGSFIFYESRQHGSEGHSYTHDEFESRMGCVDWVGYTGANKSNVQSTNGLTINNVVRMYNSSYFKLPIGRYGVTYDMKTKQLNFKWVRNTSADERRPAYKHKVVETTGPVYDEADGNSRIYFNSDGDWEKR